MAADLTATNQRVEVKSVAQGAVVLLGRFLFAKEKETMLRVAIVMGSTRPGRALRSLRLEASIEASAA